MDCVGCGHAIDSGFAFCPRCGARQPLACPGCGHRCQADFAFCPKCGTKLAAARASQAPAPVPAPATAPPAEQADRRIVTVLFADLSGFTALSERLDPEVMQALQNALFEALTAAVEEAGGFVDKFLGDALLALFGAPRAHEDDPERALRAALAMVEATATLDRDWRARTGTPLSLHFGISTGPVVTGGLGAGAAKAYSVTGDTVNTAQRLQSLAKAGEILVGPATHRLTRHAFAFEALGEVELRGKSGRVPVHRLSGPLAARREARGLEALGLSAPLVGRDAELARLLDCLHGACAGNAQLVRLAGEAGIGKTRLVREFLARLEEDPAFAALIVRRAACSQTSARSYGMIGAILRSAYDMAPDDAPRAMRDKLAAGLAALEIAPEEVRRLAPLLGFALGLDDDSGMLRHVEPEQLKRQIQHAVRVILEQRLARAPVLLVIEDLHWADAASIEILRLLADRLERKRLMILLTHRPEFEAGGLAASRAGHVAIRLAPLSAAQCHALIDALFGTGAGLPAALRTRIIERAGGNPLFVEETIRGLIESGALLRDGAGWRFTAGAREVEIPPGIQALLLARFDRLPRGARQILQEAAALGPSFEVEILRRITAEPGELASALDLLCDAEFIDEASGPRLRFTQALLHDVVYQNLLVQRRTELHGRIARALEQRWGADPDRREDLVVLGHHFARSADRARGARLLAAAGDQARATYANEDAIGHYRAALEALASLAGADRERFLLSERIADLQRLSGAREIAMRDYEVLRASHRAAAAAGDEARILRKLSGLLWESGEREQAELLAAAAEHLLGNGEAPIEHAHLLQERGRRVFRAGDHGAAARLADQALAILETAGGGGVDRAGREEAAGAMAEALNTKGVALARLGRMAEAQRLIERSIAVAESAGLLNAACRGYSNLGVLYALSDPARAITTCRRGLEIATRIGDLGFQARINTNLAVACCTFTDRCGEEGIPAAEKAVEIDRALGQREHLAVPLTVLAQIHQCHGRPDLAFAFYDEALAVALESAEPQLLFPCYDGLATLHLDRDEAGEAERYFGLAQELCIRHGLDPAALIVLPFLD